MKIAISSEGETLKSNVDPRFGRAQYFIIFDTETNDFKAIDNKAITNASGAGTKAAQLLIDKGISVLISSNVGPNAMDVFDAADITVYKAIAGDIKVNLEEFLSGKLEKILEPTKKGHHGLN